MCLPHPPAVHVRHNCCTPTMRLRSSLGLDGGVQVVVYKAPFGTDLEHWCPNIILPQTLKKKKDEVNTVNDYQGVQEAGRGWKTLVCFSLQK